MSQQEEGQRTWWSFVQSHQRGRSNSQFARMIGVDPSAMTRWSRGDVPDAYTVIRTARVLQYNVLDALVAADFITQEEAGTKEVAAGLAAHDDVEMLEELIDRAKGRAQD